VNEQVSISALEIEARILANMRKIYSDKAIAYFNNPCNMRRLNDPDGAASVKGVCGDTMEIYLVIENGVIEEATFFTDGCGTTRACGSSLTTLVKGRTIREGLRLSPADMLDDLGGFPWEGMHCAILSAITFHKALADYMLNHQDYEREKANEPL
jgi:nitrogen fixation NifU-like protein